VVAPAPGLNFRRRNTLRGVKLDALSEGNPSFRLRDEVGPVLCDTDLSPGEVSRAAATH